MIVLSINLPSLGLRVVEVTILCSDSLPISPSHIVVFPLPAGPEIINNTPLPVARLTFNNSKRRNQAKPHTSKAHRQKVSHEIGFLKNQLMASRSK